MTNRRSLISTRGMAAYEPFVYFLTSRPCAPLVGTPPPINCVGLFELATRRLPRVKAGYTSPFVLPGLYKERDYWVRRCLYDDMLREWVNSPLAFRSPDVWPKEVEEVLPPWVTPIVFSAHVTPHAKGEAHLTAVHKTSGIRELCAYAMGWPVLERDHRLMVSAAQDLMTYPTFTIWAYDLDMDGVPLPFGNSSIMTRLAARERLETNPLACGRTNLRQALPAALIDSQQLLRRCPRKSDGVGTSRRRPMISNDEVFSLPSHLTPASV